MFNIKYFTTRFGRKPVKVFILKQDFKTREKILETIAFLEKFGFQLPTDFLRKMSGTKKLWELRIKCKSINYRIFLAKKDKNAILLLHAIIKKRQKTPLNAIKVAGRRLKEFNNE